MSIVKTTNIGSTYKATANGELTAKKFPLTRWKEVKPERDKLNFDRNQLNGKYVTLKDEVRGFEQIRRGIYDVLREEEQRAWRTKGRDTEL